MPEQFIPVKAYTDTGIFTGVLSLPTGVRLSDFINLPAQFLHFKNEDDINNERTAAVDEIHLNKKSINLLTTVNDDDKGGFTQKKKFPYVNKIPVSVKIYVNEYEINGNLFGLHEDSLTQMLERNQMFLPCTDVDIHNRHSDEKWHANFVAVNQNNISVLQKTHDPL